MKETKYYSHCCGEIIPDYPDSDFCPKCKEHCTGMTEEELREEELREGEGA